MITGLRQWTMRIKIKLKLNLNLKKKFMRFKVKSINHSKNNSNH